MGYPDDLKVLSCMTLFNVADPSIGIFEKVLDKFYDGDRDKTTLDILMEHAWLRGCSIRRK